MEITPVLLEEICGEQKISALALVTPEGKPHNTPVWVNHHQGYLYIFSKSNRAKIHYASQNPDCMIAFAYASLRGTIELFLKGSTEYTAVRDIVDDRYGDNPRLAMYKKNWDTVMKITPTQLYR